MVDVHCHLTDEKLSAELDLIIKQAGEAGVTIITNGTNLENSRATVKIAENHANVWACIGIHPEDLPEFKTEQMSELFSLTQSPKVVGIGETGLDFREDSSDEEKQQQKALFELNLDLAIRSKLPIVVHNRNADEDIYEMLYKHRDQLCGILLHCFTRNVEYMKKLSTLGCYFSFGGLATYGHNSRMRKVITEVPIEKLLLETDSPYSLPLGAAGIVNNPANVRIVAETVAGLKNLTVTQIEQITTQNAYNLFKLTTT